MAVGMGVRSSIEPVVVLQAAAVATGNGTVFKVKGENWVLCDVTIATTATITFETRMADGTWTAKLALLGSTGAVATTATATGQFYVNVGGMDEFRARISAWTTGAVDVKARGWYGELAEITSAGGLAVLEAANAITSGSKAVTTSGTAVALTTSSVCSAVIVTAKIANTNPIYFGGSTVLVATPIGTPLQPGQSAVVVINDPSKIFIDAVTNGEGVVFNVLS